jgi:hypothetical protein
MEPDPLAVRLKAVVERFQEIERASGPLSERDIYKELAAEARAYDSPRRIECASCHKAPSDDPAIDLVRHNVKGVPGVFLCQWCDAYRHRRVRETE